MSKLKHKTKYSINYILIIDALLDGELQTAKTLEENLYDYFTSKAELFPRRRIKTSNINAFRKIFEGLTHMCENGTQPLIHIEAHGDKTRGLQIGEDYVAWGELIEFITPINTLTKNNCGLILASCFGSEISKSLPICKPCPFNFSIAPSAEAKAGEIRDNMSRFYKDLMSSSNLNSALSQLGSSFVFFDSSKYFLGEALRYFSTQLIGKRAKALREKIITDVKHKLGNDNINVKLLREEARKIIADPKDIYTHHAEIFLHGKAPLPYKDFENLVSAAKRQR
ncbi:hypothetical protein [Pseudomonas putida]|uniref:hypothetical protein n=1 Tax=Pseudomonas putida TaxID=303 RepID=UPI000379EFF3|nr:hypothetical protein [Pseudomonas putida]ANC81583.1 hypothetical protein KKK_11365 [Pseudomonas putida B6-2]